MKTVRLFVLFASVFFFVVMAAQDDKKKTKKSTVKQESKNKTSAGKDTTKKANSRAISNKGLPTKGGTPKKEMKGNSGTPASTDTTGKPPRERHQ